MSDAITLIENASLHAMPHSHMVQQEMVASVMAGMLRKTMWQVRDLANNAIPDACASTLQPAQPRRF